MAALCRENVKLLCLIVIFTFLWYYSDGSIHSVTGSVANRCTLFYGELLSIQSKIHCLD